MSRETDVENVEELVEEVEDLNDTITAMKEKLADLDTSKNSSTDTG